MPSCAAMGTASHESICMCTQLAPAVTGAAAGFLPAVAIGGSCLLLARWFGLPLKSLRHDFDRLYAERLAAHVRDSSLDAIVLLALDRPHDARGEPVSRADSFYVPNEWVLKLAASFPEFLAGVSIHPLRGDALEELERCLEQGAALLKLVPSCQNVDLAAPRLKPFWRRMAEAGLPLLAHTGAEHALEELRPEWGHPQVLEAPLRAGVTTIAAHCGGIYQAEFVSMLKRFGHLYGDTAAFSVPIRLPQIEPLLREPVASRLVHGSDVPVPISALGWWRQGKISWKRAKALDAIANPLERDCRIKRALGFSSDVFCRANGLLRLGDDSLRNERAHENPLDQAGRSCTPPAASVIVSRMGTERAIHLQERAAELAKTVAYFETRREDILRRRRGSADHVMVELDERLAVNARTLAALRRTLSVTKRQLEVERKNVIRG
jgi:uncharacterized protein